MALLTVDEIAQRLGQVKALRKVPADVLREMADLVQVRYAAPQETVYRIGQIADKMYFIESGSVDFLEPSRFGSPHLVDHEAIGDDFGFSAMIYGPTYYQTAVAAEPTTLLVLERAALDRLLNEHPYLRRDLERSARRRPRWGRMSFPGRAADEQVLVYARPHWSVLFLKLLWPLAFLGLTIAFSAVAALVFQQVIFAVLLVAFSVLAVGLVILVWSYWDWWFDTYIVTNQRVIKMLRRPYIQEQLIEAPISKIQNTTLRFPNFSSRALGWSDIVISTAGGPPIIFNRIANGPRIHAVINELVAATRQRSLMQAREARLAQIENRLRNPQASTPAPSVKPPPRPTLLGSLATAFGYFIPRTREATATTITYRKHWIILLAQIWAPMTVFLILGAFILAGLWLGLFTSSDWLFFALVVVEVVVLGIVLWQYEDYRNDLYVLTESSVIDIERLPLYLREVSKQAGFDAIQDVSYIIPSPIAEFLNYGNVLIQTAGQQGRLTWNFVEDPRRVRAEINERIAQFQRKRLERQQKEVDDQIDLWLKAYQNVNNPTTGP